MDVVFLCHSRGTVSHEPSQRESVHPAFSASSAKRVTPTVERERCKFCISDRAFVYVLHCNDVATISGSGKHVSRFLARRLAASKQCFASPSRQRYCTHRIVSLTLRNSYHTIGGLW